MQVVKAGYVTQILIVQKNKKQIKVLVYFLLTLTSSYSKSIVMHFKSEVMGSKPIKGNHFVAQLGERRIQPKEYSNKTKINFYQMFG